MTRYARDYIPTILFTAVAMVILSIASLALPACQSTPVKEAQTLQQKAFALYGTFVVYEETAASVMQDASVPESVKAAIRKADAEAKPIADSLLDGARTYIKISTAIDAAPDSATKLSVATQNLQMWVDEATPKINALVSAVKGKT